MGRWCFLQRHCDIEMALSAGSVDLIYDEYGGILRCDIVITIESLREMMVMTGCSLASHAKTAVLHVL